jgi:hypothetical protein
MGKNENDEENAEGHCLHGKKIDRDEFPAMIFQKPPPPLRRRHGLSHSIFGNGRL